MTRQIFLKSVEHLDNLLNQESDELKGGSRGGASIMAQRYGYVGGGDVGGCDDWEGGAKKKLTAAQKKAKAEKAFAKEVKRGSKTKFPVRNTGANIWVNFLKRLSEVSGVPYCKLMASKKVSKMYADWMGGDSTLEKLIGDPDSPKFNIPLKPTGPKWY